MAKVVRVKKSPCVVFAISFSSEPRVPEQHKKEAEEQQHGRRETTNMQDLANMIQTVNGLNPVKCFLKVEFFYVYVLIVG